MTTLKGLFDPKPRSRRNFLLENKQEVKAKSSSNNRINRISINVRETRTPVSSLRTSFRPGLLSGHCKSEQTLKCPSSQHTRKECIGKQSVCKKYTKPKQSEHSLKSVGGTKSMNYIHQENVPFEWTEVCPSLISHNICHQGVQTDRQCEKLTEQLKLLCTEDVTDNVCDEGTNQVLGTDPILNVHCKDDSEIGCHSNKMTTMKTMNSSQDHFSPNPSQGTENVSNEAQVDDNRVCHGSTVKSPLLIPHHERPEVLTSRKFTASNMTQSDPCFYPASYQKGVIPKYLTKRKMEKALAAAQAREIDPNCPAGHVVMPDHERRETLDLILKNYNDLITELNRIPVRTDTLKMQQRKREIEKQLDKLEEGIRVFSRSKVYVKLDE